MGSQKGWLDHIITVYRRKSHIGLTRTVVMVYTVETVYHQVPRTFMTPSRSVRSS